MTGPTLAARTLTLPILLISLTAILVACDRPPGRNDLTVILDAAHLGELEDNLNDSLDRGTLTTFADGPNHYSVDIPDRPRPFVVPFIAHHHLVPVPFGFADVRLNDLRFTRASLRWSGASRSLELTLTVQDKDDGLLADAILFGRRQAMQFAVRDGRIVTRLEPRIGWDRRLDFAEVRTVLLADTAAAIPQVRGAVADAMAAFGDDIGRQLQEALDAHGQELRDWFHTQLPPNAELVRIDVEDDRAIFRAEALPIPEDLSGDGRVDVTDLIILALDFGRQGPPGLSPADVNRDGAVNVVDLVLVAIRIGTGR